MNVGELFPGAMCEPIAVKDIDLSVKGLMVTFRNKGGYHTKRSFEFPATTLNGDGGHIEVKEKRQTWPICDQIKIQSFPTKFEFGANSIVPKILGNSVPPLFL